MKIEISNAIQATKYRSSKRIPGKLETEIKNSRTANTLRHAVSYRIEWRSTRMGTLPFQKRKIKSCEITIAINVTQRPELAKWTISATPN